MGFSADSLGSGTETERVLHVSFHTTMNTTVSELVEQLHTNANVWASTKGLS